MKKFFACLLLFICLPVKAASNCNSVEQLELNEKAAEVKVSYELVNDKYTDENNDVWDIEFFRVSILNLSEDLYIKVTNNITNEEKIYEYSDVKDGIITFDWDNVIKVAKFNFEIYTSDKTACPAEKLKTLNLNIPRFNQYYSMQMCNDSESKLCEKYVTWNEMTENEFFDKLGKDLEEERIKNEQKSEEETKNPEVKNPVTTFLNTYKFYILAVVSLIILSYVGYVIYKKNKAKREKIGNNGGKL